ncbi:DUF3896 family protein [Robertmurraya andreesenii]|uniref:DNA polymerase II small subunit/DNA polymerase delta subunit B n=1 Tax=Anoxybacillus andreesenii TaxID=1325932 RepID=A0ABT9V9K9_9BACL|nr:DUF3896 family protein [Robertmurraya andreesenii]MDQ0157646.1 DNA polymerase II small subunit/DNA polymerase delta subunit B [Robertmurraya andreesenii]
MDYQEVKSKLEALKKELMKKMEDPSYTKEEIDSIQKSIDNYEYIIELTDMNHYERGAR